MISNTKDIFGALNNLENMKIAVIGDLMLDKYYYGDVKRISPEAPVPVVNIRKEENVLGGAANVANNILKLGCRVYLSGVIGSDESGQNIKSMLVQRGIDISGIFIEKERPTTTKTRVVGLHQQIVRLDLESNKYIGQDVEHNIKLWIKNIIKNDINVVIISDYNKGVCSEGLCKFIIEFCNKNEIKVIADPKGKCWEKYASADFITPNIKELSDVLNTDIDNEDMKIDQAAQLVLEKYSIKNILVTRSEKGMSLINKFEKVKIPTYAKEVFDVSGAGDTVVSVLSALIAAELDMKEAVKVANIAAGISIGKLGTYAVSRKEIIEQISDDSVVFTSKIIDLDNLDKVLKKWREEDNKIIFTNGCFDILHVGHITYLQQAAQLGNKLIIGLNSDTSVKRLKGERRPIINENNRAMLLAALEFVDGVIIFDEDTPRELVKFIQPDILVKGGDYKVENIAGREYAKETIILPFINGCSTTGIIDKIEAAATREDLNE